MVIAKPRCVTAPGLASLCSAFATHGDNINSTHFGRIWNHLRSHSPLKHEDEGCCGAVPQRLCPWGGQGGAPCDRRSNLHLPTSAENEKKRPHHFVRFSPIRTHRIKRNRARGMGSGATNQACAPQIVRSSVTIRSYCLSVGALRISGSNSGPGSTQMSIRGSLDFRAPRMGGGRRN